MDINAFDFTLPSKQIAKYPKKDRSSSKLLCLNGHNNYEHMRFIDFPCKLKEGDLLVINDTKVIKARIYANKETGGSVEILLERIEGENLAIGTIRASKSPNVGQKLILKSKVESKEGVPDTVEIINKQGYFYTLEFSISLLEVFKSYGHIPLPPYMSREAENLDDIYYQSVFATALGSVAAPTASLHFDEGLLDKVKKSGVLVASITLHVGRGTFQPIKTQDVESHKMHAERYSIPKATQEAIEHTKRVGGRVIAIGTTVLRALEAFALNEEKDEKFYETDIFIYPGFRFQMVDVLVTNFHLPKSSLLLLVSAFAGQKNIKGAYEEAIEKEYSFYSYGDAMLLFRAGLE